MGEKLIVPRSDGGVLAAEIHGPRCDRRPIVVCWPGAGLGSDDMLRFGEALLNAGWPNVVISPRGTGDSSAPRGGETMADLVGDACSVVRAVTARQVVFLGVAFGNRVARALSKHHPDLVCGIILVAAGGEVPPHTDMAKRFLAVLNASTKPALRMCVDVARATSHSYYGDGGEHPMLVLQGAQDEIAPRENAIRIAIRCPHRVSVVEIENAGHALFSQQPERVIREIDNWMRNQF